MKLQSFQNNKNRKLIVLAGCMAILLFVSIITVYRSFAFYEAKKEFNVIQGQVPDQNYDLMLRYTKENKSGTKAFVETMPLKSDYTVSITCNNDAIGTWNYEQWAPVITNLKKVNTRCTINFKEMS